jgi:hypothetical protein
MPIFKNYQPDPSPKYCPMAMDIMGLLLESGNKIKSNDIVIDKNT